jgi:hypothetical protein
MYTLHSFNPLAYTAACEAAWATDVFAYTVVLAFFQ